MNRGLRLTGGAWSRCARVEARGRDGATGGLHLNMDGDGVPEIAVGTDTSYNVLRADLSLAWSAAVSDRSCCATGTAFDFLGDASAEARYADETELFIFDGAGAPT